MENGDGTVRTGRLILRRWRDEDLAPYAALNADARVMEHFPSVLSRDESDAQAARIRKHWDDHGFGVWAVAVEGGAPSIGFIGVQHVPFEAPFTPAIEVGWRLAFDAWGHGYATEGARAALDYGFGALGLREIVAMTVASNDRSWHVMEKLGMRRAHGEDFDHPRLPEGHRLRRHILYRIAAAAAVVLSCTACSSASSSQATGGDSGAMGADSGGADSSGTDSGTTDAGRSDGGSTSDAGNTSDSGASDAGGTDSGGAVWSPSSAQPIHFHWQLSDAFATADLLPNQQGQVVYDIDGEHATAADVQAIHAAGAKAVCYVDVGSLEMGRSDYAQFPQAVIGPAVQGWPNENWLLVTASNQSIILPLMKARFANWCVPKGFDAIEPDNLDAFTNIAGQVTQADNLAYDLAIANAAHAIPLSIGLKNLLPDVDASYVPSLLSSFDWALVEQCFQYSNCTSYTQSGSFVALGKAVWDVEYSQAPDCTTANAARMNAQQRDLNLVAPTTSGYMYSPCIPDSQTTW